MQALYLLLLDILHRVVRLTVKKIQLIIARFYKAKKNNFAEWYKFLAAIYWFFNVYCIPFG